MLKGDFIRTSEFTRVIRMRVLLLVFLSILAAPVFAQDISGIPTVIDGDTIDIDGQRIRLHGIDAPESKQICTEGKIEWYCGKEATAALTLLIQGRQTDCWKTDTDRYGRTVAVCLTADKYLNALMVSGGHAVAYSKYSKAYVPLEQIARKEKRGLWKGKFVFPWNWRKGVRSDVLVSSEVTNLKSGENTGNCNIKGNISRSGRIYHVPGGSFYERTKISEHNGERWFCSEKDALNAGWRRSKR